MAFPYPLPILTGRRLEKFLEVSKNLPRNPSCNCIIITEAARMIFDALFREQIDIDMGVNEDGKQTKEETPGE